MRIISGKYRGKHIQPPSNFKARPTTDFAKEALFNIFENNFDIQDMKVLDLFSGTGSISFEFASRGCTSLTAIEMNPQHFKFIRRTIESLDMHEIHALRTDVYKVLKNPWEAYDLVFADPPYDLPSLDKLPEIILGSKVLDEDGWLVLEHPSKYRFNHIPNLFDHRNYGNVNFSFFRK